MKKLRARVTKLPNPSIKWDALKRAPMSNVGLCCPVTYKPVLNGVA